MIRKLGLILIFILPFPCFSQENSGETTAIFIDTRLLMSYHPLFKNFDPETRRFKGTSGDPSIVKSRGISGLDKMIAETKTEISSLPKKWASILKNAKPSERKELEKGFIKERKVLDKKLEILSAQKIEVKMVSGLPAFSEKESLLKEVCKIANAIQKTAVELIEQHKAQVVIDVSSFVPVKLVDLNTKVLFDKVQFEFWKKTGPPRSNLLVLEWLREAKKYWANNDESFNPIPYGAVDCRIKAVNSMLKLLEEAQ